jgi:hypothetical protein
MMTVRAFAYDYGSADDIARKAVDWGTILIGGGASAVPLFTILENFIMSHITNPKVKVAANIAASLIGWFIPGLAAGMDPKTLLFGALTTSGGAALYHDLLDHLGSIAPLVQAGVSIATTAGQRAPVIDPQKYAYLQAKSAQEAALYEAQADGSYKLKA